MIRSRKFFYCTSTRTALLLFIIGFIAFTTLFRHDNALTTSWSIDDAPEAGMFMPLTRPGWKTGNPNIDNSIHIVGGNYRSPIIDAKGSDNEFPPPAAKVKRDSE